MFRKFLDITRRIETGMQIYQGDPEVRLTQHTRVKEAGYAITEIRMGTHTGTHLDYPGHIFEDSAVTPDLSSLIGPCDIVHASSLRAISEDESFRPDRLIVKGGMPDPIACQKLLGRGLLLVGTEAQSVEPEGLMDLHRLLLGAGIAIIEGLDLEKASSGPAYLIALPISTAAPDGAPVRAILAY